MALPLTAPYFQPSFRSNLLKNYPFLFKLYHKIGSFTAHPLHPFSQGSDLFLAFSGYCPLHSCFRLQFLSILSPYCSVMHAALLSFFFLCLFSIIIEPFVNFLKIGSYDFFQTWHIERGHQYLSSSEGPMSIDALGDPFWTLFRPKFAQRPTLG